MGWVASRGSKSRMNSNNPVIGSLHEHGLPCGLLSVLAEPITVTVLLLLVVCWVCMCGCTRRGCWLELGGGAFMIAVLQLYTTVVLLLYSRHVTVQVLGPALASSVK
jgi:hypothetical protein